MVKSFYTQNLTFATCVFLSSSTSGDENFIENKGLLDYSKLGEAIKPSSLAVSEFHFLLLIGNRVKVHTLIDQKVVISY